MSVDKCYKVKDEQESAAVQNALFKQGLRWAVLGDSIFLPSGLYPQVLYARGRSITWGNGFYTSETAVLTPLEDLLNPQTVSVSNMLENMVASGDLVETTEYPPAIVEEILPMTVGYGHCEGTPDTNPKQSVGNLSLPMSGVSPLFKSMVALGKLNGSLKYGKCNYLGTKVVLSIYLDAIERHLDKIKLGEWYDVVDKVPHLGAIGANCDVIASAQAAGTLINDLGLADGQLEAMLALVPTVKSLQELHKDRSPKHYYMKDN